MEETNPDPFPIEERRPDDATILHRLRTAYGRWGWAFLYDSRTSTWTALRGRDTEIVRTDPVALRVAVDAAQPPPPYPEAADPATDPASVSDAAPETDPAADPPPSLAP